MAEENNAIRFERDKESELFMAYRDEELVSSMIDMGNYPSPGDLEHNSSIVRGIHNAASELEDLYTVRRFTPGTLTIGGLGEVVAAERHCLNLFELSHPIHEAYDHRVRLVQIETTQSNKLQVLNLDVRPEDRINESGH